jgi:hypothetical protein|tara:strand:+ start:45 stop:197 length:153 start_codon:yes stop_codon:yes gene_type:complete
LYAHFFAEPAAPHFAQAASGKSISVIVNVSAARVSLWLASLSREDEKSEF